VTKIREQLKVILER